MTLSQRLPLAVVSDYEFITKRMCLRGFLIGRRGNTEGGVKGYGGRWPHYISRQKSPSGKLVGLLSLAVLWFACSQW
jgi:hypothetical protein